MELTDEESRIQAVEKVLEEMHHAEEMLMSWNFGGWLETYEESTIDEGYFHNFYNDNVDYSKEQSKINFNQATDKISGIPLRHITVEDKYNCQVTKIKWSQINTKNAKRTITFSNDGNISLEKRTTKKETPKHPISASYEIEYNVLTNEFEVLYNVYRLMPSSFKKYQYDVLYLKVSGDILIKKYNDIEIIENLTTGQRTIKIAKKYDRNKTDSVVFNANLDREGVLVRGSLEINTHKRNGKINGTYRMDVSPEKGVRANFYSRKGVKVDLTTKPALLSSTTALMLPSTTEKKDNSTGLTIVNGFANSTQNAIAKSMSGRTINFNPTEFNMGAVLEAEKRIIEMLKSIRSESPLYGLGDRIDDYLYLIEENKLLQNSAKKLKLQAKTKK